MQKVITIKVSEGLFRRIEKDRKLIPRSTYIREIIKITLRRDTNEK